MCLLTVDESRGSDMKKRDWELNERQQGIYQNLKRQICKILEFKTHFQGRRGTERYQESLKTFAKHLAIFYGSQNFRNISRIHLESFIEESKKCGLKPATIKNDLSAIRMLHRKLGNARYKLPTNEELGYTEKRQMYGIDRAWSDQEFERAVELARQMKRTHICWALQLARYQGLRIEEVTALTRTQLRDALRQNYLSLEITKNKVYRDVPLEPVTVPLLEEVLENTTGPDKFFITHGRHHHQVFKSVQNWILAHRPAFQSETEPDQDYLKELDAFVEEHKPTFHGLRHSYAREQYLRYRAEGFSMLNARQSVAMQLGHGRDQVTKVYLGKHR